MAGVRRVLTEISVGVQTIFFHGVRSTTCAASGALLTLLRFLAAADERKRRAGHYGNVGASDDLQEAKRMRYFFVAPLVSANHRDPKHLDLRGLDHHEQGLQIAASGAGAVLVDDDLAARLG